MNFTIRNIRPEEHELVRDWGNKEHWNQGMHDYLAFKLLDNDSFWIGELDGEPIAHLAGVQYDENFAFIGIYIVKPQYRGKGYGIQVWNKVLSKLTAKNIALEGVPQQQPNYVKSGFKTYHKTIRYISNGTNKPYNSDNLVDCNDLDFEKLSAFDRKNFPAQRKQFLKQWISLPESKAVSFVKNNEIEGYGVIRVSYQGHRIGPLFANSDEAAQQVLKSLVGSISQQKKVFLDIPEINKNALKLAEKCNFKATDFACARMYTNGQPDIPFDKTVYGFTSIQFG